MSDEEGILHPRENPSLVGHGGVLAQLLAAKAAGKLHHGLLITGPKGCGKATFAYHLARVLLSGDPQAACEATHPTFRRIIGGGHGDLLVIEQEYDEKKDEPAREIAAEEVRGISEFLSQTAAEGFARVVVIDAADAMNHHAANAILKALEEPPAGAYLLLVCHSSGRLLPTIRSRCQQVKLAPLTLQQAMQVLEAQCPNTSEETRWALCELAQHSPGLALEMHKRGGLELYAKLAKALAIAPANARELWKFSEIFAGKALHAQWLVTTDVLLQLLARTVRTGAGERLAQEIVAGEGELLHKLLSRHPAAYWADAWQRCAEEMGQAARLHQDYRQTMLGILHGLEAKAA